MGHAWTAVQQNSCLLNAVHAAEIQNPLQSNRVVDASGCRQACGFARAIHAQQAPQRGSNLLDLFCERCYA